MLIPIKRGETDPFYRYKMESVDVVQNKSKTTIVNLTKIAKSLYRPPELILKYIEITLGCKATFNSNQPILSGQISRERVQKGIYDFIDDYVICKSCTNPETKFVERDDCKLSRVCSSCGKNNAQPDDKFTPIIVKAMESLEKCEDKNYTGVIGDLSSTATARQLVKLINPHQPDNKEVLFNYYSLHSIKIKDLFTELIKPSEFKMLKLIIQTNLESAIVGVITMVDKYNKSQHYEKYLKGLLEMGISIDDIVKSYDNIFNPTNPKIKNNYIKKLFKSFIDDNI